MKLIITRYLDGLTYFGQWLHSNGIFYNRGPASEAARVIGLGFFFEWFVPELIFEHLQARLSPGKTILLNHKLPHSLYTITLFELIRNSESPFDIHSHWKTGDIFRDGQNAEYSNYRLRSSAVTVGTPQIFGFPKDSQLLIYISRL